MFCLQSIYICNTLFLCRLLGVLCLRVVLVWCVGCVGGFWRLDLAPFIVQRRHTNSKETHTIVYYDLCLNERW